MERRARRKYTETERHDAVLLAHQLGCRPAARQLGIPSGTLANWVNAAPSRTAATLPTQRDEHIATILANGLSQWRWESGYTSSSAPNLIFGGRSTSS